MKFFRILGIILGIFFIGYGLVTSGALPPKTISFLEGVAAPFFSQRVTADELKNAHRIEPTRVLVVPGHDKYSRGAYFGGVHEADLNLILASELHGFLGADPAFETILARELDTGEYVEWFSEYVIGGEEEIRTFRDYARLLMRVAFDRGEIERNQAIRHNPAADNTSLHLYAINKWANENDIDLVLHVHLNDYPGRPSWGAGEYTGFSIYVPEGQLPNGQASADIAQALYGALARYSAVSDYPPEAEGVVPTQDLIAVGSNASRNGVSLLLEYGYIYEPQFQNPVARGAVMRELAYHTYRGLKIYFEPELSGTLPSTTLLPRTFSRMLAMGARGEDVLALQTALLYEGYYPPEGATLHECPLSGYYGQCTARAVSALQSARGRTQTGVADTDLLSSF